MFAAEGWFDPIEAELRGRVRQFLEEMIEQEATAALGRGRYERGANAGYRNGTRTRRLLGSFGPVELAGSAARLLGCGRHEPGMAERRAAALRPDDAAGRKR